MEKLMEHTLARQNRQLQAELAEVKTQVSELTGLIKTQLTLGPAAITSRPTVTQNIGTLNTGPVVNHQQTHLTQQLQVNVHIKSFDSEDRIHIPIGLVKAAFTENPRLIEYCRMSDDERVDADKAAPYVLEALVDLIRRAHKDPVYRNVHLNPRRADQVMVCVGEDQRWEVRALADVIRVLFDGVADNLHQLIVTDRERTQLPLDVQSAASWVPNLYEDEPERFVKEGKAPMAAHLANTAMQPKAVAVVDAK